MNLYLTWKKYSVIISPVRVLALLLIILGLLDNLTHPTKHNLDPSGGFELALRILFIFCGVYGIMGSGKSKQIRATLVGIPYVYLAVLYGIAYLQSGYVTPVLPMTIAGVLGLWTITIGATYERRDVSINNNIIDSSPTKPRNKVD
jgi:hypothetical protein